MVIPVQVRPRGARQGVAREVRAALAGVDPPMYAVTTAAGGERAGCLVAFLTQCGVEPIRFLVCLSKRNHSHRVALAAPAMAVHALGQEHRGLAALFATTTGDCIDKFSHCGWAAGPGGMPILTGCRSWFVGTIDDRVDLGDHTGLVLAPIAAGPGDRTQEPLSYSSVKELIPGH